MQKLGNVRHPCLLGFVKIWSLFFKFSFPTFFFQNFKPRWHFFCTNPFFWISFHFAMFCLNAYSQRLEIALSVFFSLNFHHCGLCEQLPKRQRCACRRKINLAGFSHKRVRKGRHQVLLSSSVSLSAISKSPSSLRVASNDEMINKSNQRTLSAEKEIW